MLLLLSGSAPADTSWSRGDIIAVVAAAIAVLGPPIAIWAVRYKLRIRVYVDTAGVLAIIVKNRGRVSANVGPPKLVVRGTWVRRLLLGVTFHHNRNRLVTVLQDALPATDVSLAPNDVAEWHLLPQDRQYLLPRRRRPFAEFIVRKPLEREKVIEVNRGAKRRRYVRRRRKVKGQFQCVPTAIAQQLQQRQSPVQTPQTQATATASAPAPGPANPTPGPAPAKPAPAQEDQKPSQGADPA